MFRRRNRYEEVKAFQKGATTLELQDKRVKPRQESLHNVGETTGMFRARTAEAIQVDLEHQDIDIDQLPESLRRLLRQGGAG